MADAYRQRLRQTRTGWGWIFVLVWIIGWAVKLNADRIHQVDSLTSCGGLVDGAKCWGNHEGADIGFSFGIVAVVVTSPLMFIAAHYFALWRLRIADGVQGQIEAAQQAREAETVRRESQRRMTELEGQSARQRLSADRGEAMHKLGAVGDFLTLLDGERDPERIAKIKIGAVGALRDLTAKHTIDDLAALFGSDPALSVSLAATLRRLDASPLADTAEAHILGEVRKRSGG
jgi:hypothetical protein